MIVTDGEREIYIYRESGKGVRESGKIHAGCVTWLWCIACRGLSSIKVCPRYFTKLHLIVWLYVWISKE